MEFQRIQRVNHDIWIERLLLLVLIVYAIGVLYWFHDRSWFAPDDGFYAHIADRILAGDVPGRDIEVGHPGYGHFANAAALAVFGMDLLSLRYPLAAMAFLSCVIVFKVVAIRSAMLGFVAAVCVMSLSVVQFFNPAAHWYSFFLFAVIVGSLTWIPVAARWRIEVVGFLTMTLFLFHQLNGVYAAIAVVAYVLTEAPRGARGSDVWVARAIFLVMAIGVAVYFCLRMQLFALLAYGIWPLAILTMGLLTSSVHNRDSLRVVLRLAAGASVAALPIVGYHLGNGSVVAWLNDTFITAMAFDSLDASNRPQYSHLVLLGFIGAAVPSTVSAVPNGLFWMILPLLPAVLGAYVVRGLFRGNRVGGAYAPLPFLACFYSLVSLRLQIPVYLFLTVPFTMAGLCWISTERRFAKYTTAGALMILSAIGMIYHAGQPLGRYDEGNWVNRDVVAGERLSLSPANLPRATLQIEPGERDVYEWLVRAINRESTPDDTILALPYNAELYFLTGRRNSFRFASPATGIRDREILDSTIAEIRQNPPRLVVFRNDDPFPTFNSALSNQIMGHVRRHYHVVESRYGFDIFRYAPGKAVDLSR